MSKNRTLTIDLKIPLEVEHLIGAPALTFSKWLPIGKDKGIKISANGIDLNLWFEIEAAWWASQPTEKDLKNHQNVLAHYILCEVKVTDINSMFADYMQDEKNNDINKDKIGLLKEEYKNLGEKILSTVLTRLNRLISYARNIKGQYWLVEHPIDMGHMSSRFIEFKAVGRIDGGKEFSFYPRSPHYMSTTVQSDERYIREDEWDKVRAFVGSVRNTPLVLELLAGAEQLAGNGYERGALTEAVTALEVALSDFAESHKNNNALTSIMGARMSVPNLKNQIRHMGLSGTVNYLLPVILTNDILPDKVLKGCQNAIEKRQNVVHNGSRKVENVNYYISNIRTCCQILMDFPENE